MSTLDDMLAAAATAAGQDWGSIKNDVTSFAQDLIQDTATTAANAASGAITQAEAKVEFDEEADFSGIIANYASDALKVVAQAAFNAAVDTLWTAIVAAIP
jgi:hypothetical protein